VTEQLGSGQIGMLIRIFKRKKRFVLLGVSALLALGAFCAFFRISNLEDIEAYREMARECHPVWKQLALRRFGRGDAAQELFRRFPPTHREEFGIT